MNILKLAAMLTLDGTRFKAGIKEAESAVRGFGKNVAGAITGQLAAAFGGGALVGFIQNSFKEVAGFKDLAEQMHMNTDEVQRFKAAAEDMGLTISDVGNAERQFNKNRKEAVESNQELRDTFAKYGVTLKDLQNPQFKFSDFLFKANAAMQGFDATQMQRGLNDMADILGDRVGPKLQEFIKQLQQVKDMEIVPRAEIERADKAMDKLAAIKRAMVGRVGIFASETLTGKDFDKHPFSLAAAGWKIPFRFWKTMLTGKGLYGETGPGPDYGPPAPGAKLFDDTIEAKEAKKNREEFAKAKSELDRAMLGFGLSKRASLEARIREGMDFIGEAEGGRAEMSASERDAALKDIIAKAQAGASSDELKKQIQAGKAMGITNDQGILANDLGLPEDLINAMKEKGWGGGMTTASAGARKDLIGLIEQLQGMQEGINVPGVSSLTSVGQLGGRSFVNSGDNEVVKAAKELLKPAERTATATEALERKLKPGGTIKVQL